MFLKLRQVESRTSSCSALGLLGFCLGSQGLLYALKFEGLEILFSSLPPVSLPLPLVYIQRRLIFLQQRSESASKIEVCFLCPLLVCLGSALNHSRPDRNPQQTQKADLELCWRLLSIRLGLVGTVRFMNITTMHSGIH